MIEDRMELVLRYDAQNTEKVLETIEKIGNILYEIHQNGTLFEYDFECTSQRDDYDPEMES